MFKYFGYSGVRALFVPTDLYPGGVKTGELVHTSPSQNGFWWRQKVSFTTGKTTPECSEDRTAVPSVVKTESEFCVCTQCVSTLHTHTWRTAKLSDQTHKHWIHPLTWENLKIFKPYSIGQQLSQQSQHRIPFDETALQQQLPTITFIHPLHLLVIHFWLAHRLLAPSFTHLCTNLHAQHVHITKRTGWVGWITQATEGPTLGSWVTHPLSMLLNVSKSHHWNEHQTLCEPCTKQDTWNQTWYHLHLRATLFNNYTHNNSAGYVFTEDF